MAGNKSSFPLLAGIAVLALAPLSVAQSLRLPVAEIEVMGLADSTGAKVMLINAKGTSPTCGESVLLSPGDPHPWRYDAAKKSFLVEVGSMIDAGCWCPQKNDFPEQDEARLRAGIAVMAPGKAIAYYPNQQRIPHPDARIRARGNGPSYSFCSLPPVEPFHVGMRPRREVPVMVWTGEGKNVSSLAHDEIANADWIFDTSLAGVTLRPIFHVAKGPHPCSTEDADCCDQVTGSGDFEPGSVNVYYGTGTANFTCPGGSAVFIHDVPILGDLAHELGHALGLSQSDNKHRYSQGHTTENTDNFACDNIMWEGTHFLKDELSPGQAFWTSESCGSFLTYSGACLSCTEGGPSVCPAFTLGQRAPQPGRCVGTEVKGAKQVVVPRLLDRNNPPASCDLPTSTYASGRETEKALTERYKLLQAHVRGRADLRLGSLNAGKFLDRWEPNFALNLAPKPSGAQRSKQEALDIIPPHIKNSSSSDVRHVFDQIRRGETPVTSCTVAAPKAN